MIDNIQSSSKTSDDKNAIKIKHLTEEYEFNIKNMEKEYS